MRAVLAAFLAAASSAACSEPPGPYAAAEGDRVTLTVRIGERVDAGSAYAAKELRIALDGRAGPDGAVDARIIWLELDHGTPERMRTVTSGVEGEVAVSDADTLELARTRLLDAMRDRRVHLRVEPKVGLVEFAGLTAAFADAWHAAEQPHGGGHDLVAAAVDDAAAPLAEWVRDDFLLPTLQVAGLAAVPPGLLETYGSDVRVVPVHVPGRGAADVRAEGRTGESGGRPTVRLEGRGAPDMEFHGDPGPPPPPEIGLPDPASVAVVVETEYLEHVLRPLNGHADVSFVYEGGYRARRWTAFTLVMSP